MQGLRSRIANGLFAGALLVVGAAHADTHVVFVASSAAYANAARSYEAIWAEYGDRIVASFEARTCLPFPEPEVAAVIADAVSNSGGPEHPMQLRATYPSPSKQSTLVHELGHRHLWQLAERLDGVDGHRTLDLVLDRVWADVWGEKFAAEAIRRESAWDADYDYAAAWSWARSLTRAERARLWNRLLTLNGFPGGCDSLGPAK
ncbi:MAG TPA: hypothetical protein VMU03_10040 [Gammaproteobacteria bacterium]|nr:hypothetical protein [Gammaproteobacteria bacterium]